MKSAATRLRILVLGYVVRGPLGGIAWHYLQYVLGLSQLGHDVFFFEDSDDYPSCYDPVRNVTDADATYGLAFADGVFARIGLGDRWTYYDAHRNRWLGPAAGVAIELCHTADVVLNVSGVNPLRPWMSDVPVRILVDTDPGFTQIRHLTDPAARARANQHTAFFSFGENIGCPGCTVPADGFPWVATRQPVVMDEWTPSDGRIDRPLSTVMQWDSYRAAEHNGTRYAMKGASFAPFLDLPARSGEAFTIALGAPTDVREHLAAMGGRLLTPGSRRRIRGRTRSSSPGRKLNSASPSRGTWSADPDGSASEAPPTSPAAVLCWCRIPGSRGGSMPMAGCFRSRTPTKRCGSSTC